MRFRANAPVLLVTSWGLAAIPTGLFGLFALYCPARTLPASILLAIMALQAAVVLFAMMGANVFMIRELWRARKPRPVETTATVEAEAVETIPVAAD